MRASWLLLTHFSQRYPKVAATLSSEGGAADGFVPNVREPRRPERSVLEAVWTQRTGMAVDLLSLNAGDVADFVALREAYALAAGSGADDGDDGPASASAAGAAGPGARD